MRLSTIILMVFIILASTGLSLTQTEAKRETSFKGRLHVGWARTDITPDRPVALVGQPYKRISQRVRDPLTATALALETRTANGSIEQAIMVSCDIIYISKGIQSRLREAIKSRITDFDPEKLFLNATHTHTAPGFVGWSYDVSEDEGMKASEYADYFIERVSKAVVEAWKNRKPGAMSWALGHAVIGMNRRSVYFDGSAAMYGGTNKENFSNIEGYEDHGVELLFFWNQDRKLTGLVVNIACPAQETEELSEISADFWHDVRIEFSRRISNDVFILPQCAAAGDISPHLLFRKSAEEAMRKRRGLSRRQEIARRITDAIEDVLPLAKKEVDSMVRFEHTVARIDIPNYNAKVLPSDNTNPVIPIEFHVIRLGDVSIATNPFELYLDYGIRMKARSPAALTFIVQTSCQIVDYLPTEKAVKGGGYSADKFIVGPEGGQILVNEAVRLLNKMWVEFTAALEGDSAAIQAFLEQGVDVNARDQWERTALHLAAGGGHKEVVGLLLEHGADVNAKDRNRTALDYAAEKGHKEVVELLLEHGADVNVKDDWDRTPLHSASEEGHKDIVELLITEGANVNARDRDSRTPLQYAAEKGHKEVVGLLLAHGADVNAGANYNRTAAEFAMGEGHTEIVELLISKGADISPLYFAIYMKDEGKARSLIEGGADVNKRTPYGTTPLDDAIRGGLEDIARLLIDKGADVNAKDNWNWTPLHTAAGHGCKDIAELLIAKGADVNARDGGGSTPLRWAKTEGHSEIVQLLRKHGAKE